ncbi:stage V sporulation protein D [Candidatus Magnetomorum sp. HK-1]|nr:stage V sporulation protein D [Candidatus Magnetomorum sp. HK-1]
MKNNDHNRSHSSQADQINRFFEQPNQYPSNYTGVYVHLHHMKRRIRWIGLLFGLCFLAIFVKALYIQIYKNEWLSLEASKQYIEYTRSPAKRGIIYDRQMHGMAVTIDSQSVFAHPLQVENKHEAAQQISSILKMSKNKIRKKLTVDKRFVWIKRLIGPNQAREIKKKNIPGIHVRSEPGRVYPNKSLASQVIGFTGIDGNGLEGLEYYYNSTLAGKQFISKTKRDAYGREFLPTDESVHKNVGQHIVLTIDQKIQYFCETILKDTVSQYEAKAAYAIVMKPDTGEILSLAHYPTFNPNIFNTFEPSRWRNKAVTDTFEPGSTMKIFLAAAAIESNKCDANSIFFCENGAYSIGSKTIHDSHPYGWLSLQQIIKHSSNVGAVKIGELLGAKYMYKILKSFGFANKTDIDCPAEATGSLMPYDMWTPLDQGAICFGHGISVSAIQLLTAACAIANGGVLMKPFLVKKILSSDGQIIHEKQPQIVRRAISQSTASQTRKIMQTVVSPEGTGFKAALDSYSVCGKTGTSRKLKSDGTYARSLYFSSFLGFVPAKKPEIAVLIVVDEPEKGYYGGHVAAPAFKRIAYKTLQYLSIQGDPNNSIND